MGTPAVMSRNTMTDSVATPTFRTPPPVAPSLDTAVVAALLVLSVSTGMLDAVSYLALDQVFTGNMTGNVLFLGFAFAGMEQLPVLNLLVALGSFFIGAVVAALVVRRSSNGARVPMATTLMLMGGAILTVGVGMTWSLSGAPNEAALVIITGLLSFALGSQSSALKPVGIKDISTVVVTMTMVNLAGDGWLAGKRDPHWLRKLLAIVAMGVGAYAGASVVFHFSGAIATYVAGTVMTLGIIMLAVAGRRGQRERPGEHVAGHHHHW